MKKIVSRGACLLLTLCLRLKYEVRVVKKSNRKTIKLKKDNL